MFVASEEATSGSVMQNAERISPSSSGRSQRSCCWAVPADLGQRRVLQVAQTGAQWRVRQEQVPQPAPPGLHLQLLDHTGGLPRVVAWGRQLPGEDWLCRVHALVHEGEQPLA